MMTMLKEDPLVLHVSFRSLHISFRYALSSHLRKGIEFKPFHAIHASFNRPYLESQEDMCISGGRMRGSSAVVRDSFMDC
jgi:hypothetical protein